MTTQTDCRGKDLDDLVLGSVLHECDSLLAAAFQGYMYLSCAKSSPTSYAQQCQLQSPTDRTLFQM